MLKVIQGFFQHTGFLPQGKIFYFIYFTLLYFFDFDTRVPYGHQNSVNQLLWVLITQSTLSTFSVEGTCSALHERLSTDRWLVFFSYENWVRVILRKSSRKSSPWIWGWKASGLTTLPLSFHPKLAGWGPQ